MGLSIGDKAPTFSLKNQAGETVKLSQFKGRPVVVYFYPRANTPGCTTQACALRDAEPELSELNAAVLGISPDPVAKLVPFVEKYDLNFALLSDEDHSVCDAYGAWGERSLYGRKFMGVVRSAFVIDGKGKIAGAFPKISPKDTVPKVSKVLEGL